MEEENRENEVFNMNAENIMTPRKEEPQYSRDQSHLTRKIKRERRYCVVVGCRIDVKTARASYSFPKDPARQQRWLKLCGRPSEFTVRPKTKICFRHFAEELQHTMKCRLLGLSRKKCFCQVTAVDPNCEPTLNLPNENIEQVVQKEMRKERARKRQNKKMVEDLLKIAEKESAALQTQAVQAAQASEDQFVIMQEDRPLGYNQVGTFEFVPITESDVESDSLSEGDPSDDPSDDADHDPDYLPFSPVMQLDVGAEDFFDVQSMNVEGDVRPDEVPVDSMAGLCRTCGQRCDDLVQVFSGEAEEMRLKTKIEMCLHLQIREDDELPVSVCRHCICRVDDAHSFVSSCQHAQLCLTDVLTSSKQSNVSAVTPPAVLGSGTAHVNPGTSPSHIADAASYNDQESLDTHVANNHIMKCTLCSFRTQGQDIKVLDEHFISEHINKSPPDDPVADGPSDEDVKLKCKLTESILIERLVCRLCNDYFKHKMELAHHYDVHHAMHLCDKNRCYEIFPSHVQMQEHCALHGAVTTKLCPICGKCFRSNSLLDQHVSNEHRETQYKCHICDKCFRSNSLLDQHISNEHRETQYKCHICNKCFRSNSLLDQHISNEHRATQNKCHICNKCFRSNSLLEQHISNEHRATQNKCHICNKCFRSNSLLDQHISQEHRATQYKCHICDKCFRSNSLLDQHVSNEHRATQYKCHICDKCFRSNSLLDQHICNEHRETQYKCHICDKCFRSNFLLDQHISNEHRATQYKCHICDKCFRSNFLLDQHISNEHRATQYKCHICDKCFRSNFLLDQHVSKEHRAKQYKCHICNKCFRSNSLLDQHFSQEHSKTQYKCHICDKVYKLSSSYTAHVKTHNVTMRQLRCDTCGKTFNSKRSIAVHIQNCHIIKKFKCDSCQRLFETRTRLQMHKERVHSQEWSYHCVVCEESFSTCQAVTLHFRTHSPRDIQDFEYNPYYKTSEHHCQICLQFFQNKSKFKNHFKPLHGITEIEYFSDIKV